MAQCEVCGNEYDKTMEIRLKDGSTHIFDSFECASHALAPTCDRCGVKVMGHGVETGDEMFCSAHCAQQSGVKEAVDHVPLRSSPSH